MGGRDLKLLPHPPVVLELLSLDAKASCQGFYV